MKAQAVQHAKNTEALATAAGGMRSGGFLGDITHAIGSAGSDLASNAKMFVDGTVRLMNAPLKTVQQEYKYLHDVEARHGMDAAVAEGLGLVGEQRLAH